MKNNQLWVLTWNIPTGLVDKDAIGRDGNPIPIVERMVQGIFSSPEMATAYINREIGPKKNRPWINKQTREGSVEILHTALEPDGENQIFYECTAFNIDR